MTNRSNTLRPCRASAGRLFRCAPKPPLSPNVICHRNVIEINWTGTIQETESTGPHSAWRSNSGNFQLLSRFFLRLLGAAGKVSDSGHGRLGVEAISWFRTDGSAICWARKSRLPQSGLGAPPVRDSNVCNRQICPTSCSLFFRWWASVLLLSLFVQNFSGSQ